MIESHPQFKCSALRPRIRVIIQILLLMQLLLDVLLEALGLELRCFREAAGADELHDLSQFLMIKPKPMLPA